jgi:DNA (cytosine-5)-methyltransferase 1
MDIFRSVSLFSGAGFGDIGFQAAGLTPVLLAEIDGRRAQLAQLSFPTASVLVTDVLKANVQIADIAKNLLDREELFLLSATPPCQGMSKNGIGTLLRSKERGFRPKVDPRNRLYLPVLELAKSLRPRWVFFENVCRMMNTYDVGVDGRSHRLPDIMEERLRDLGYAGRFEQVQLADYGLPQTRLRTVGIFRLSSSRHNGGYLPPTTHCQNGSATKLPWVTLRRAIGHLPPIDSKSRKDAASDFHPLHRVPVWRRELYAWMAATPEGCSALDNSKCESCGFTGGPADVTCGYCGRQLPRPSVVREGARRLIKGFPSAYKRMKWDKPASTVTTRSAYACSDHKVHPDQNRVLSTLEVALIQGIDPNLLACPVDGRAAAYDTLLRDVIGECVPPLFARVVGRHILALEAGEAIGRTEEEQLPLFQPVPSLAAAAASDS